MNAKMLVQALRDSKAQVMFAFLFAGHAMDNKEIQEWTGLKRQTIDNTVASLEGMGLLGHQMAEHGRKIFLPAGEMLPLFQMSPKRTSDPLIDVVVESNLIPPSITTTITTISQMSPKRTSEELASLTVALNEYRIIGKKREQLMACEWVSGDYVRAHVEAAKEEGIWDQPVGMAITRMLEQVPAPEKQVSHGDKCQCAKCKVDRFMNPQKKYLSGPYSDMVEH